ncbi:energy transducer TonB [Sulfurimonas sp.]|nr:energy transducer TonB [Sulfurimonas sp.]
MNRSHFALFVALLIHLLFLMLFWLLGMMSVENKKLHVEKDHRMKVSLREPKKKAVNDGQTKKTTPRTDIAPPMPKGSQLKKIVKSKKQDYIKYDKNKVVEKVFKTKPKPEPIVVKKAPRKKYIKLKEKKKPLKKKDPMSWLYDDKSHEEVKKEKKKKLTAVGLANHSIKELYGSKFGELSAGQQKYILDNQEIMRRITQQVLTRIAGVNIGKNINVNRINVIEFYLHPNGDMSDFKFLKNSGYRVLDETTKETIKFAYSKYPKPSERTLIRYNVYYNLKRYK